MFKVGDRVSSSFNREYPTGTIVEIFFEGESTQVYKVRFDGDKRCPEGRFRYKKELTPLISPNEMICEDWS